MREHQVPAIAIDLTYIRDPPANNPLDINSPAGFAKLGSDYTCGLYGFVRLRACVLKFSKVGYLAGASRTSPGVLLPNGPGV